MDKDMQLEALKLYIDWSKWLSAMSVAVIAGLFLYLSKNNGQHLSEPIIWMVCAAMACLLISFWGSVQLLFSIPGIVKQLDNIQENDVDLMKNPAFRFNLRTYQRIQYAALYPAAMFLIILVGIISYQHN